MDDGYPCWFSSSARSLCQRVITCYMALVPTEKPFGKKVDGDSIWRKWTVTHRISIWKKVLLDFFLIHGNIFFSTMEPHYLRNELTRGKSKFLDILLNFSFSITCTLQQDSYSYKRVKILKQGSYPPNMKSNSSKTRIDCVIGRFRRYFGT